MKNTRILLKCVLGASLLLPASGCDLDVPDLNNPGIDQLEDNPTPSGISAASTGLLIGSRGNFAQANGYVAQLGILGREAYNFDQADPRFINELLKGQLNPGSPFGGNFWTGPYANIRVADIIVRVVDQVVEFDAAQRSAIKGFAHTIKALDLMEVISAHDTNGAVIQTGGDLDAELPPIEDKAPVLASIAALLDMGATELAAGGDEFVFPLSTGFVGFDTPPTFLLFNRALRARVAVYQEDYQAALTALAASFLDDGVDHDLGEGAYYAYSTGTGDTANALINPNIFAHPSVRAEAEAGDLRLAKIVMLDEAVGTMGYNATDAFTLYTDPNDDVPIIRNEELILLRAEARFFTSDTAGATDDLNLVRTEAGGLDPIAAPITDEEEFVDALLYERRYSLLFEGGHRWLDARRFDRVGDLAIDQEGDVVNLAYPIPDPECNARPASEPKCN
jgi:starch-binding outer membrane protein, SusD/RagB family